MAYENGGPTVSVEAGTAVTRYRFLTLAADGQVDHTGTAQADVDFIAMDDQATVGSSVPAAVPDGRFYKVEAGAAVARGALVATDSSGRAITHVAAVDNVACGRAIQAASAAGEIITIQFVHKRTDAG